MLKLGGSRRDYLLDVNLCSIVFFKSFIMQRRLKIKKLLQILLLAVILSVSLLPANHAAAADPAKCFNQLAGTVYLCTGTSSTAQSGSGFEPGKCYIYSSPQKGWQESDCGISQFASINGTKLGAVPVSTDPAACGKSVKTCCKVTNSGATSDCGFIRQINIFISFLSVIVGVACALGIIIGGIEYSTSGGDPKRAASGKSHITKAVVAVVLFGFLYSFLQFIIPGGFLNG